MFEQWKQRRAEKHRKRVLANIRALFEAFGHDTSQMTDEELEIGLQEAQRAWASLGFTANEAAASLSRLVQAGRQAHETIAQAQNVV